MENYLVHMAENGGPVGVLAAVLVYLIVFIQRRNTSDQRNTEKKTLQNQIDSLKEECKALEMDKLLLEKDIDLLKDENIGIKQDIKEIKDTLQKMALSLERIASKYDDKD